MNDTYEPDDKFVEKLEWQLSSEYRRTNRFKSAPGKIAVSRRVAAIAVMVGVAMTGLTVLSAAEYLKDSWRKKIEIARAETDVKLKKARQESTQEMASRTENLASLGLIQEEEILAMKQAVEKAGLDLSQSMANLDEVKASGEIPRHELYAPVVGGRDFVGERLEIEKKEAELDGKLIESRRRRFQQLLELGLIGEDQRNRKQAEMASQKARIDEIQIRLALRKRFVAGMITAQEVEIQDRLTAAERNLSVAQSKVDSFQTQLKRLQKLEALGMISATETHQLQYDLDAAQAELKLAAVEKEVLTKRK
jgi:multidrug resistance efflux pump